MQTDSKDAKILDILKKNSRESYSVLNVCIVPVGFSMESITKVYLNGFRYFFT